MSKWITLSPSRHQVAIAGRVSDAQTGRLISGALVELIQMPEAFKKRLALQALQYGDRWPNLTKRPDRTYTALDGSFYFIDLPGDGQPDNYTFTVSLPNAGTRYGFVQSSVTVAQTVEQVHRATVEIALPPTALKGQIKNAEGEPLVMAQVHLSGSSQRTFTDSVGNYWLTELEASASSSDQRIVMVAATGYDAISEPIQLIRGHTHLLNLSLQLALKTKPSHATTTTTPVR